jgi:hypothetical protein
MISVTKLNRNTCQPLCIIVENHNVLIVRSLMISNYFKILERISVKKTKTLFSLLISLHMYYDSWKILNSYLSSLVYGNLELSNTVR